MSDIALLAHLHLAQVLGSAPSGPTVRHALDLAGTSAVLDRIARARANAWNLIEDISGAPPAGLFLNLINHLDVIGVALNTLPVSFIFELGTSLLDEHPLAFLRARHVHSVADVHYLSRTRRGPAPARSRHLCLIPARLGRVRPRSADRSQHVADV